MTPKQALLAHLAEYHGNVSYQTHRLSRWNARKTLKELQRAHGYMHHHYGNRTHSHGRPDEPPNRGPDSRPEGWKTGLDVIDPHKMLGWGFAGRGVMCSCGQTFYGAKYTGHGAMAEFERHRH